MIVYMLCCKYKMGEFEGSYLEKWYETRHEARGEGIKLAEQGQEVEVFRVAMLDLSKKRIVEILNGRMSYQNAYSILEIKMKDGRVSIKTKALEGDGCLTDITTQMVS